jgi:hypothetical protein
VNPLYFVINERATGMVDHMIVQKLHIPRLEGSLKTVPVSEFVEQVQGLPLFICHRGDIR